MNASPVVTFGIPLLALTAVAMVVVGVHRSAPAADRRRRVAIVALGAMTWLSVSAALARSGFYLDLDARPPRALFLLIPTFALALRLGFSTIGKDLARRLPLAALIGFHAFRLPLELVMHVAAREGTMPEQMTFTGWNFDILTGLSALVIVMVYRRGIPRRVAIAWNFVGTGLLLAIVGVAVASLPVFHAFGSAPEQLNTWIAYFPFVWLPAALVASALLGHVVLWRRLLAPDAEEATTEGVIARSA